MSIFSKYDDIEDLALYGSKDLKKFILANYQKFPIYELSEMLNITPGFIQETLSTEQLKRAGNRSVPTILIIRDISMYPGDADRWLKVAEQKEPNDGTDET